MARRGCGSSPVMRRKPTKDSVACGVSISSVNFSALHTAGCSFEHPTIGRAALSASPPGTAQSTVPRSYPCRLQARARRAVRAVREGEQRAGVRAGGSARGMAGGDEARDASVPDAGAAAGMVGEMGGAFGGARRVRRRAFATFGRQQYRRRRESAVVI
jgi:hypothetical protein